MKKIGEMQKYWLRVMFSVWFHFWDSSLVKLIVSIQGSFFIFCFYGAYVEYGCYSSSFTHTFTMVAYAYHLLSKLSNIWCGILFFNLALYYETIMKRNKVNRFPNSNWKPILSGWLLTTSWSSLEMVLFFSSLHTIFCAVQTTLLRI